MKAEQQKFKYAHNENEMLHKRMKEMEDVQEHLKNTRDQLTQRVQDLNDELNVYRSNKQSSYALDRVSELRHELTAKENKEIELLKKFNKLQNTLDDVMTENRALRKLAGVGDNWGVDLSKVRLEDQDHIIELKRANNVLKEDNEALEAERTKLK